MKNHFSSLRQPAASRAFGLLTLATVSLTCATCLSIEFVLFERGGSKVNISGEIVVEANDGSMLLRDRKGTLWTVQSDEIKKRSKDHTPFKLMGEDELSAALLEEMPAGFKTYTTAHYLICYNTSPAYAQWCGGLFERLYKAFTNFWKRRGLEMEPPSTPLVALVFADRESYKQYAEQEIGEAADSIVGYYNLATNRIVMYDLTGVQATANRRQRGRNSAEINKVLSQPDAGKLVATVIH
ncbi:MAG: hypothetical protein N2C12_17820, partial [Planctomycetales bacterium]